MIRHARPLALLATFALATSAAAQYHGSDLVCGSSSIVRVSPTGAVTSMFDNPGAVNGLATDVDNRHIVFGDGGIAGGIHGIVRIDPATNAVTTVIQNGSLLYHPMNLIVNFDGDYVFTNRYRSFVTPTFATFQVGLFKLDRNTNALTTLLTTQQIGTAGNWSGGLAMDIDDGSYVIQDRDLATGGPLIRLAPDGTTSTMATGFTPRFGIAQDYRTGDWYSASGNDVMHLQKGLMTPTPLFGSRTGAVFSGVVLDRQSAPRPRLVSVDTGARYHVDLFDRTLTTIALGTTIPTPWGLAFDGGRNLASVRTGPGRYAVNLRFPGEGGRGYAVALGFAGVRPGIPLLDGRTIHLAFDALVVLSLRNALPGIWQPGPGVLDAAGEATATLDVSAFGALDVPCWCVAMTIGTSGVATIADPIILRL